MLGCREAGELLAERKEEVLRCWEKLAREAVLPARVQSHLMLRDGLPDFLDRLAEALQAAQPLALLTELSAAHEYAERRRRTAGYTLGRVILEYHLLRRALMNVLEAETPLAPEPRTVLNEALDQSVRTAETHFGMVSGSARLEAEEHYRLLLESMRDYAIFSLDAHGKVVTWSPGAEHLFAWRKQEILGESAAVLFTPEDRAHREPEKEMETALRQGWAADERWHQRKDGTRFFATGRLIALRAGPFAFAKVVQDATDRKVAQDERDRLLMLEQHARAEAEQTADRLRRLQSVMDVALVHSNLDDLLRELLERIQPALRVDSAAILLRTDGSLVVRAAAGVGMAPESTLPVPLAEGFAGRIARERRPLAVPDVEELPPFSSIAREGQVRSLLGVPLLVEDQVVGVLQVGCLVPRVFDTEETRLLQLVADRAAVAIERVRLFQEAERRSQRLQLLSDASADLLLKEQPEEFIRSVYERLAAHLGLEVFVNYLVEPTGKGMRLAAYAGIPAELARRIGSLGFGDSVCGSAARERRAVLAEDIQHSRDPRSELVRSLGVTAYACHPLISGDQLIGTLSFGTRSRASFQADEVALMKTVCDQVAVALQRRRLLTDLQLRAEALVEADRRKDEFLAMLAHELRNPLSGISNAAYVLDRLPPLDSRREYLREVIRRQTGNLSRMVDDLLDVSRITQNKVELRKERVDLCRIAWQAVEAARPIIGARGHTLHVSLPDEPIHVEADPTRMEQVLTNLLNNAAKYMDPGGEIWLSGTADAERAELRVRDTGVGIPAPLLAHIFDLFTQSQRSLDRSEGGLGIGLTLARSLVELHGGTLQAHSEGPGRGSEFVVILPRLSTGTRAGSGKSDEGEASPLPPLRLLLVEDNPDAAETMAEILRYWGVRVHVASSGTAALQVAADLAPEVVLLDIGLPGMDGYEVARRLRAQEADGAPRRVLVALTGYGQEADRMRSHESGFDHHLVKPVNLDELQRILSHLPAPEDLRGG